MRARNMGFTLLIMVLFPDVTSAKMGFTSWKLERLLLQITLLAALTFFTHQQFLTNTNQCENKGKLSSDVTRRLRDSLNRSSEMSINDVFPHCITGIKNLRRRNANKVIFGNLNIKSLPNKFGQLRRFVLKYVDVLVVTETKLDDNFLTSQFLVTDFSVAYRLDRNRNGGGIMIFIHDDIPSKVLTKHVFPDDIEGLLLSRVLEKLSGYFFGRITHQLKVTYTISII